MVAKRLSMTEVYRHDGYSYLLRHQKENNNTTIIRGKLRGNNIFNKKRMKAIDLINLLLERIKELEDGKIKNI